MGAWSPYLVGALIGLLSMATFYFSNKPPIWVMRKRNTI